MNIIYSGGGSIGNIWPMLWGASWPFGELEISESNILLKVFPFKVNLPLKDIDFVSLSNVWTPQSFLKSIRFYHHGNAPIFLYFSSKDNLNILKSLEVKGVKIK